MLMANSRIKHVLHMLIYIAQRVSESSKDLAKD